MEYQKGSRADHLRASLEDAGFDVSNFTDAQIFTALGRIDGGSQISGRRLALTMSAEGETPEAIGNEVGMDEDHGKNMLRWGVQSLIRSLYGARNE